MDANCGIPNLGKKFLKNACKEFYIEKNYGIVTNKSFLWIITEQKKESSRDILQKAALHYYYSTLMSKSLKNNFSNFD